jgi:hypothetical protein
MPAGRPAKYDPTTTPDQVRRFLLLKKDADHEMIAAFLEVSEEAVVKWQEQFPEFAQAIWNGKEKSDTEVVQALYQKAIDGDVHAARYWLNNRQGKHWRERQSTDVRLDASDELQSVLDVLNGSGRALPTSKETAGNKTPGS